MIDVEQKIEAPADHERILYQRDKFRCSRRGNEPVSDEGATDFEG